MSLPGRSRERIMQERFVCQLIAELSAGAANEVWQHSGHLISDERLLEEGIRDELLEEAWARLLPRVGYWLRLEPTSFPVHPQFAERAWSLVCDSLGAELVPLIDVFFVEYCALLRSGTVTRLTLTPVVVLYFDHFCEALQHSRVEWIDVPREVALREGGILRALLLSTPTLRVVRADDAYPSVLDALAARDTEKLPPVQELHAGERALSVATSARLARWFRETNHSVVVYLAVPTRPDQRQFVDDFLGGRRMLTRADTDWLMEQWSSRRKRRRDAELCPRCGVYDPQGRHYFRFVAGRGMYSCDVKDRRQAYEWETESDDDTCERDGSAGDSPARAPSSAESPRSAATRAPYEDDE